MWGIGAVQTFLPLARDPGHGEAKHEGQYYVVRRLLTVNVVCSYIWSYNEVRVRRGQEPSQYSKARFRLRGCGGDVSRPADRGPRHAGGLRRNALDWSWFDSRSHCICGLYGTRSGDDSHNLPEKG